jgi:peptide/nickel transport system substrate-binding protein
MKSFRSQLSGLIYRLRSSARFALGKKSGSAKQADRKLAIGQVMRARETKSIPSAQQIKHLPTLLSRRERLIALIALIAAVVAGVLLGWQLIDGQRITVAAPGGEYTEGLIGSPQLINPIYAFANDVDTDLTRLIYNGLMRFDTNDGLVFDLAESVSVSEDERVYTFTLRNDATWHDGEIFRARDVIFTMQAIQDIDYRSPLQASFSGVTYEQIDDMTVQFTLDKPYAPFLSLMVVGILPSHIWDAISPLQAPLAERNIKPIGTGPYAFEKLVKDSNGTLLSYTLRRHNSYHRGSPNIDKLNFKFYPSVGAGVEALRNGNIEGLSTLPEEAYEDFVQNGGYSIHYPTQHQYTAIFFNENHAESLKTDAVRTALAHATDKELLISSIFGERAQSVDSFILPGSIGYHPDLETNTFDPALASALLEEAGWTLDEGSTVRRNGDEALRFELVIIDSPELSVVADALAAQWLAIGVDLYIRPVEFSFLESDVLRDRSYDMLLSGEQYGIDPDPFAFWHSSQAEYPGLNLSGFRNRSADDLIDAARSTSDASARRENYIELQDIVAEELPAIFLYQPSYFYITPRKIQGISLGTVIVPADRFSLIEKWYIKTRRVISRTD